eukprot:310858-Prymnesium_polylepis.1
MLLKVLERLDERPPEAYSAPEEQDHDAPKGIGMFGLGHVAHGLTSTHNRARRAQGGPHAPHRRMGWQAQRKQSWKGTGIRPPVRACVRRSSTTDDQPSQPASRHTSTDHTGLRHASNQSSRHTSTDHTGLAAAEPAQPDSPPADQPRHSRTHD